MDREQGYQRAEKIREEYAAGGVTYKYLGRKYGYASRTIFEIVHRTIWNEMYPSSPQYHPSKLDMRKATEIRDLHYESGVSRKDLAARFNVSLTTIGSVLNYQSYDPPISDDD